MKNIKYQQELINQYSKYIFYGYQITLHIQDHGHYVGGRTSGDLQQNIDALI